MSLKIFQTDFFHFLNAFRRINTILMMLVFTFFNADVMKFHVAAILRIKMLEAIQKKWNAFKWITLLRNFPVAEKHFISPRMYKVNIDKNYFSHCHFSRIWIPTFERDLSQNESKPQVWTLIPQNCKLHLNLSYTPKNE